MRKYAFIVLSKYLIIFQTLIAQLISPLGVSNKDLQISNHPTWSRLSNYQKRIHSNFMSSFFTFKFMHLDLENIKMT